MMDKEDSVLINGDIFFFLISVKPLDSQEGLVSGVLRPKSVKREKISTTARSGCSVGNIRFSNGTSVYLGQLLWQLHGVELLCCNDCSSAYSSLAARCAIAINIRSCLSLMKCTCRLVMWKLTS